MKIRGLVASLAVLGAAALPAAAQDVDLAPNFGTLTLEGGFEPDPRVVRVVAGGNINAASSSALRGRGCTGFITRAPDVRLNFEPGSRPLIISVNAVGDTTLVVNQPDGRFLCDDDGGRSDNPSLTIRNPQGGAYEIWIGTFRPDANEEADLHISEESSQ